MNLLEMIQDDQPVEKKLDSCFEYKIHLEGNVEYAKYFLDKAKEQMVKAQSELKQFEEYLETCLMASGKEELKGNHKKMKFRAPTYKVSITDIDALPDEFKKTKTEIVPDKITLKNLLKDGELIDGAEFVPGKKSVIWRNK